VDSADQCRVAVDYFCGQGYRNIASVVNRRSGGGREVATIMDDLAATHGFSHSAHAVPIPRYVYESRKRMQPDPKLDSWLQGLPKPIGIVTTGGYSATFIEQSASRQGFLVPGDVAILSRSDDEVCLYGDPPISAIDRRGPEIGGIALRILDETLQGGTHPRGQITLSSPGVIERRSTGFPSGMPEDIKQAALWIRDHACEGLDVAGLLQHIRTLSRTRLYDGFSKYLGHSPAAEIRRVRINSAKCQLAQTNLSVGAISENCGYSGHSLFTEAFRQSTGMTPLAWRKQHLAESLLQ